MTSPLTLHDLARELEGPAEPLLLRVALSSIEGASLGDAQVEVDALDGLTRERLLLACERAVPSAHRAVIEEIGQEFFVVVQSRSGEVLACGWIEAESPSLS